MHDPATTILPSAPDGEPLCAPPELSELCDAARRLLPEFEAELHRRLSGPDRSVEAVELEKFAAGSRAERPDIPLGRRQPGEDPLLEQGVLALCAARLLGRPPTLPLAEALALHGVRVARTSLPPDQPPRALDAIGLRRDREPIEVCRASPTSPAARALIALSAAGLARPLVLIAVEPAGTACYYWAGLPLPLRDVVARAAAPRAAMDAAADMAPLTAALAGRNPWHLYRIAEAPWDDSWAGAHIVRKPLLTPIGQALAERTLSRPPSTDETFFLACQALAAAERLCTLSPEIDPGRPLPDDGDLGGELDHLAGELHRLTQRPLLPQQEGEAPLFLKVAARGRLFIVEARHPDELGRLLTPAGAGFYARLRLFRFPSEPAQALSVTTRAEDGPSGRRPIAWSVDGGDLRVHIELAHGGNLLSGLP